MRTNPFYQSLKVFLTYLPTWDDYISWYIDYSDDGKLVLVRDRRDKALVATLSHSDFESLINMSSHVGREIFRCFEKEKKERELLNSDDTLMYSWM